MVLIGKVALLLFLLLRVGSSAFAPISTLRLTRRRSNLFHSLHRRSFAETNNDTNINHNDIAALERDVLESAKARLDLKRVVSILDDAKDNNYERDPTMVASAAAITASTSSNGVPLTWKISLAAAAGAGSVTYLAFNNMIVAGLVAFVTAVAALGDPLEEDGIGGALARVVGRLTLQSVDVTQSKVRAMARAVVMGEEEISSLKRQLEVMEQEVSELRRWKQQRLAVDEALPRFALDDLKELARQNGITVGGIKAQLLMRLVEAGIIDL